MIPGNPAVVEPAPRFMTSHIVSSSTSFHFCLYMPGYSGFVAGSAAQKSPDSSYCCQGAWFYFRMEVLAVMPSLVLAKGLF